MKRGEIIAHGVIRGRRLLIKDLDRLNDRLPIPWDGRDVVIGIRLDGKPASSALQGYAWAEVYPVFAEYMRDEGAGDATAETAHDVLAQKFLGLGPCPITGMPMRRSTSPSVMTEDEYRAYLVDQVLPFLRVECGLDVKDPDPTKRSPRRVRELQRRDEERSRGAIHG